MDNTWETITRNQSFFMSETVKGRSMYHTVEELTVIVQGHYQVSTYKLMMTEKHYNSNLKNIFDSLTYRVFRNVEPSPPKARVEEIRANLRSRHREHDTSDDTDSSMTDSESNSEDDKTELSSSDSEIDSTEGNSTQAELSDDSVREFNGFSSLFNEQEGSGLVEDDASDSDDDQESSGYDSNSGDNKIELRLSDSESADENTEPAATESVRSDDSECELLDGLSSLFGDRRGESDLGEDDQFDSDDYQESSKDESNDEYNKIELRLSDSDSADDNTEPTATETVMSDDSVCELLDGLSSLFDAHGESDLGDDDELCYQRAEDEGKSVDKEDGDAAINYDQLQSCVDEDSLGALDGVSTLFEEPEYGHFPDDEESTVGMRGESKPEDKQEPVVQSTPKAGHWETAIKSLKIAAGVAGVGLALYAAYKYFR